MSITKLVSITELATLTGLSISSIRRRIAAGTLPYTRANSQSGKIMFDPELIQQVLRQEAYANLKSCTMDDPEPESEPLSYLASLFKESDQDQDITPPSATFSL
jgi:predicted DNA-binding transcriptional regulator AlpA